MQDLAAWYGILLSTRKCVQEPAKLLQEVYNYYEMGLLKNLKRLKSIPNRVW